MEKLSLDQIIEAFIDQMGNPLDEEHNKDEQYLLFQELSKVEGLEDWLRTSMGEDIKRYFKAQNDDQRSHVKGEFARTLKMLTMIRKVREMDALKLSRKPVAQKV